MSIFRGKNSIKSTSVLGRERAKYKIEAFPENNSSGPKHVLDFNFAERTNYGRVDVEHNPVYPDLDYIVPLMSANGEINTVQVMNFVSDQYADMERHFVKACRSGLIPTNDPVLSMLTAHRAFLNPLEDYKDYRDSLMQTFINSYILENNIQINGIGDFMFYLLDFVKTVKEYFPITFSGYQRSNQGSIFSSGLAIDIANIPFDDDRQKQTLMLESPTFQYYLNICKQYGFSVNRRNPGVIISDVASPMTLVYREKYDLSSVNTIFSTQYKKTLFKDLDLLLSAFQYFYNLYISKRPYKRNFHTSWSLKTITILERRYEFNINNINNNIYNNIIKLYIHIRNVEERKPYSDSFLNQIYKNSLKLRRRSEIKMFEYIDKQFKLRYNLQDGFLTSHQKRRQKKLDK